MTQYPYQQSRPFNLDYAGESTRFNFFNAVYAWMAVGLGVTAVTAYLVSMTAFPLMLSPGIVLALFLGLAVLSFGIQASATRLGPGVATALFILYAAILGAALSGIFLVYKLGTIAGAFGITAGTFGAMSLIGFVTKRDLSRLGGFLIMGAIGLFIASLVNLFLASNALSWFITYAVVIVFTGLVAYQTQMLKNFAIAYADNQRALASMAIVGALILYISFINIFLSILRILGDRR